MLAANLRMPDKLLGANNVEFRCQNDETVNVHVHMPALRRPQQLSCIAFVALETIKNIVLTIDEDLKC